MSDPNLVLPHPLLTQTRLIDFFWIMMDAVNCAQAFPFELSYVRDLPAVHQTLMDYFQNNQDNFERGRLRVMQNAVGHWVTMGLIQAVDDVKYDLTPDGIAWIETYQQDQSRAIDLFRQRMKQTLWFAQTNLSGAELEAYLRKNATPIPRIDIQDQIRTTFTILQALELTGDETKPISPELATSPLEIYVSHDISTENISTPSDESPTIPTRPIPDHQLTSNGESPTIPTRPIPDHQLTSNGESQTTTTQSMSNERISSTQSGTDAEKSSSQGFLANLRKQKGAGDSLTRRASFGRSINDDTVSTTSRGEETSSVYTPPPQMSTPPPPQPSMPPPPQPSMPPPPQTSKASTPPSKEHATSAQSTDSASQNTRRLGRIASISPTSDKPITKPNRFGGGNSEVVGPRKQGASQPPTGQSNPTTPSQSDEPSAKRRVSQSPTTSSETNPSKRISEKALGYVQGDNPLSRLRRAVSQTPSTEGSTQTQQRRRADYHPKGPRAQPAQNPTPSPNKVELVEEMGIYYYEEHLPDGRIIRLSKKLVDDYMTEHQVTREEAIRILRDL